MFRPAAGMGLSFFAGMSNQRGIYRFRSGKSDHEWIYRVRIGLTYLLISILYGVQGKKMRVRKHHSHEP